MLGPTLRRKVFWGLDTLKGRPIKQRLSTLDERWNAECADAAVVRAFLEHAIRTVPYYEGVPEPSIDAFPVVCRATYRSDFAAFRSSLYPSDRHLRRVYTGASSGAPFMAYQDPEKVAWRTAGLIGLNRRIGWQVGDRFIFIRGWNLRHRAGRLKPILTNMIPVQATDFGPRTMERLRLQMKTDPSIRVLFGYASALGSLVDYLIACGERSDSFHIGCVVADSDSLLASTRIKLESMFGCPVFDRYGTEENGVMAITFPELEGFRVNNPEYYVELLALDKDEPAPLGHLGRLVITDIYNRAFAFVRYDTGDLAVAARMNGQEVVILRELQGRIGDALCDVNGNIVGETTVVGHFERVPDIGPYQVVQKDHGQYLLRTENDKAAPGSKLLAAAEACFGGGAAITIEHVETLPRTVAGKFKRTVRECDTP